MTYTLTRSALHASLGDPVLTSINFLNEVTTRYPDAISFAPGAPYDGFFDEVDVSRYVERYLAHHGAEPRTLLQYGRAAGQINDLVAGYLRESENIDVPVEALVVTVGCQEAMFLTLRVLCPTSRDVVLAVNPCYVGLAGAARILDIPVAGVDESAGGLDPQAVSRACAEVRSTGRRPRALYVVPDFANPSGARLDLATRLRLLAVAEREDLLILEDNPYGFTAVEPRLPVLKALDRTGRVIHLGTFAKVCAPGARVGFVVADQLVRSDPADSDDEGTHGPPRYLAAELASIKSMITVNTSPIGQAVIGGMLLDDMAGTTARRAAFYRRNLRTLLSALERHLPSTVAWSTPAAGFFVVVQVPFVADDALLDVSAREFGVLWTPMRHFYLGDGGVRRLRLSCSNLTDDVIEEGVVRLASFIRSRA